MAFGKRRISESERKVTSENISPKVKKVWNKTVQLFSHIKSLCCIMFVFKSIWKSWEFSANSTLDLDEGDPVEHLR